MLAGLACSFRGESDGRAQWGYWIVESKETIVFFFMLKTKKKKLKALGEAGRVSLWVTEGW